VLKPVTKRYQDMSTMKQFEFVFYCDCCGKALSTTVIGYDSGFRKKFFLTSDEREARAIIYADNHGKAYERANNEVLHELNRCEKCGDMVCEDCTVFESEKEGKVYCIKCSRQSD